MRDGMRLDMNIGGIKITATRIVIHEFFKLFYRHN